MLQHLPFGVSSVCRCPFTDSLTGVCAHPHRLGLACLTCPPGRDPSDPIPGGSVVGLTPCPRGPILCPHCCYPGHAVPAAIAGGACSSTAPQSVVWGTTRPHATAQSTGFLGQFKRTAGWLPQTIQVPVWHLPPKLTQNTTSHCSLWRLCRKSRAGSQEAVTLPPPRTCLWGPEPFRPLYLTCGQVWLWGAGDTSRGQHVPKAIGSSAFQVPCWLLSHSRPVMGHSAVLRGC